jgi:pseudouridine synthase
VSEVRLQRFLAQAGVAARRKAELLITDGRVAVNGQVVTRLGTKVDPTQDRVTVDGKPVQPEDLLYILFNKPKACITAKSDPYGRRTVMEYLPGLPDSVVPVGRLDFYTEGVLLLTNDGALAGALLSPKSEVEKTYHVKLKGSIDDREIAKLREGVRLGPGVVSAPAQVDRLKAKSRHDWLIVTIHEGKNRQVHRMLEAVGQTVTKLQRVAFAGLGFHGLRVGDARELTQSEVAGLYELAGVERPKGVQSRGKWKMRREDTDRARRAADRARPQRTPNLTPGGSRRATAKLLARYEEEEKAAQPPPKRAPKPRKDDRRRSAKPRPGGRAGRKGPGKRGR